MIHEAMHVYIMAAEGIFVGFINGWYDELTTTHIIHWLQVYWIQKDVFIKVWHSRQVGIVLNVIFAKILFWGIVKGIHFAPSFGFIVSFDGFIICKIVYVYVLCH